MNFYALSNINNDFESYQKLIDLFNKYHNTIFEEIEIRFENWFSANLTPVLGVILDKFLEDFNKVFFKYIDVGIGNIFKKNGFLTYYG